MCGWELWTLEKFLGASTAFWLFILWNSNRRMQYYFNELENIEWIWQNYLYKSSSFKPPSVHKLQFFSLLSYFNIFKEKKHNFACKKLEHVVTFWFENNKTPGTWLCAPCNLIPTAASCVTLKLSPTQTEAQLWILSSASVTH